jgi:hypothetical protein
MHSKSPVSGGGTISALSSQVMLLNFILKNCDLYTTVRKLTSKHMFCTQLGAVMQWYHTGHPDINKQHVQPFFLFVTATSGSGNVDSSESDDLYKAHRNFFL